MKLPIRKGYFVPRIWRERNPELAANDLTPPPPNPMNESPMPSYETNSGTPLTYNALFAELVRNHRLAADSLTKQQLADAIRQAIAAGDFVRHVTMDGSAQSVVYLPYLGVERLRTLYNELILAVSRVCPGESRHATALRYIQEREENRTADPTASANASPHAKNTH